MIMTITCLAVSICEGFPQYAYAYIDPGTGSFVLQAVIAALVSIFFTIKAFWGKIKGLFIKKEEEKAHRELP